MELSWLADLDRQAVDILKRNDRGGYTVPTAGLYPHQWNWDSAFTAIGWQLIDEQRAWSELDMLFASQWPNGMVPHIIFRNNDPSYFPGSSFWQADLGPLPSSGISQPPVAATIVRRLLSSSAATATAIESVRRFLPKLDAWHRWWHDARDPHQRGVIAVTHPWESGRDNLPDWDASSARLDVSGVEAYQRRDTAHVDASMRPRKADYDRYLALVNVFRERRWDAHKIAADSPFFVADVAISAILLRAERDLLAMVLQSSRQDIDVVDIEKRIARLEQGFETLWNPQVGAYCSLDLRTQEHANVATSGTFLALYAGIDQRRDELLDLFDVFAQHSRYLMPSFDPRASEFDAVCYWRGPVWLIVNHMIIMGLSECGAQQQAERVRSDTAALVVQSGFHEYFNPINGQGCGGEDFSWTAAIWLAEELSSVAATAGRSGFEKAKHIEGR